MSDQPNPHGVVLTFGKHNGELLTRAPIGYVRWLTNQPTLDPKWRDLAKAEFERRGDTYPKVELSGHAIDNASLRVRKIWHETCLNADEGLYSWLQRVSLEALDHGEKLESGKIRHLGIKFVFEQGEEFPVLKTVMR
jgi:hypothetical protein